MCSNLLEKAYEPSNVEKRWYDYWEKNKLFKAKEKSDNKNFSIVIPPPNVTGVLHMGHALNVTMQDILCRYRRLKGDNVLWLPGTDHAGIATQNVVEKDLARKGLTRHQIGREKFIEEVWKWKEKSGNAIINQLKRLGASCDWDRERFTMDSGLSKAVKKVFVQLYKEKLIYKGDYMINWCPRCQTALADLEVDYDDIDGNLYYIKYPFVNGKGELIIATTRPETMLGDTAVAINPDDTRYKKLEIGEVVLPLVDKNIPIIRDDYVDVSFGTGALKVTPAHDPNDFEIGLRHKLETVKVIGPNGKMTSNAGKFAGQDRLECRKAVVKALEKKGLLKKIKPHNHSVGHCYRCKSIIEPSLSTQWFIKTKPLAKKAILAVKNGATKIIPKMWEKTYFEWMENIRDWCISRQIWWGHQIPAYNCKKCSKIVVDINPPKVCPECGSLDLIQETDVLDTWFSSALWPFSTMGWPENTQLLKTFYPTSTLITGFDILFFWVARMMMMGIHFNNKVPFKDVYVHALVRDEEGSKMSKSKGNVIDPLQIIDKYGTDAFRFTLAAFAAQGRDIKMSEKRIEGYRHFINKLWNSARFCLMHIDKKYGKIDYSNLSLFDKWILSKLAKVSNEVSDSLDSYKFNNAAEKLYNFVWHEYCDWYLEIIKPSLYGKEGDEKKEIVLNVLGKVLHDTLILLHPFIPFITEEIWDKLPGTKKSISKAKYPKKDILKNINDDKIDEKMEIIMGVITGIRNIRGEMNITPSIFLSCYIETKNVKIKNTINENKDVIKNLSGLKSLTFIDEDNRPKTSATSVIKDTIIYVSLEGVVDFKKESQRLEKDLEKISKELISITKKLSNEDFLSKAPPDVVSKVNEKQNLLLEKQSKIKLNYDKVINNAKGN